MNEFFLRNKGFTGPSNKDGIIKCSINDIDKLAFSKKRKILLNSLKSEWDNLPSKVKKCIDRIWIDGSFVTDEKLPGDIGDIDVGFLFIATKKNELEVMEYVNKLNDDRGFNKGRQNVEICPFFDYVNIKFSALKYANAYKNIFQENYYYWLDEFTHTRNKKFKKILEINCKGGILQ